MIDLAAYDLRPLSERLRRIRGSKDFRERQALLEAVDSGALLEGARPSPARSSTLARAPATGLPYYRAARSVARRRRKQRRRMGHAPAGKQPRRRSRSPPRDKRSSERRSLCRRLRCSPSRPSDVSPSIAAKAGLAAGAQAAVVKLASYGSGSARAASLLNYQSDKGQLTLEREDGTLVTGKAAVDDLAAHWREDDAREPSNDVFRVTLSFEGEPRSRASARRARGRPRRPSLRLEDRGSRRLHARPSRRCRRRRRRAQRGVWKEGAHLRECEISSLFPRQDRGRLRPRRGSLGAGLGAWRRGSDDSARGAHQGGRASVPRPTRA